MSEQIAILHTGTAKIKMDKIQFPGWPAATPKRTVNWQRGKCGKGGRWYLHSFPSVTGGEERGNQNLINLIKSSKIMPPRCLFCRKPATLVCTGCNAGPQMCDGCMEQHTKSWPTHASRVAGTAFGGGMVGTPLESFRPRTPDEAARKKAKIGKLLALSSPTSRQSLEYSCVYDEYTEAELEDTLRKELQVMADEKLAQTAAGGGGGGGSAQVSTLTTTVQENAHRPCLHQRSLAGSHLLLALELVLPAAAGASAGRCRT